MEYATPVTEWEQKDQEAIAMIKDHVKIAMGIEDPRYDEQYFYRFYVASGKTVTKVSFQAISGQYGVVEWVY